MNAPRTHRFTADVVVFERPDGQDPAVDPSLADALPGNLVTDDGLTPIRMFRQVPGKRVTGCGAVRTGAGDVVYHASGCPIVDRMRSAA